MLDKLTDNEIVKAVEWHINEATHCSPCPYEEHSVTHSCVEMLMADALDLINRLQGTVDYMTEQRDIYMQDATDFSRKVDRLQAENEEQGETISSLEREIEKLYYELDLRIQEKRVVEAEARKEFAERLKAMLQSEASFSSMAKSIICENLMGDVDNLLIEMESKNNEQKDNC